MKYLFKVIEVDEDEFPKMIIERNGNTYCAMGPPMSIEVGDEIYFEMSYLDLDDDLTWEDMFSKNYYKEKKLVNTGGWSYEAYGKIIGINPVIVDVGDFDLDIGDISNDDRVISEYIYFKIFRLDAY